MNRNLLPFLVAAALDGFEPPQLSTRASADGDDMSGGYATMGPGELGYYDVQGNWVPADYQTVGQMLRLPARPPMSVPTTPARPGAPMQFPFMPRLPALPGRAPAIPMGGGGITEAQCRAIVADMMGRMAPYGQVPARVSPDEALFPMGLGFQILSGGPPAVLTGVFNSLPQRAFRGERLVLSTFRTPGAATVPVIVDTFKVGDYSQLVGGAPVPVETFAPDSFGVRLMLDGAVPGVTYTVGISVPAAIGIPAGQSITVVGAVIGRASEAAQR